MQVRVQNNNVSWDKVPTKDVIDYVIMTKNKEKFQQFFKNNLFEETSVN